ncbi:glycosyltransferase family 4 protein [Vibrio aestuarianus]|nr:glycosyltransferase family 4 protein [Vibrio aestuarianus]MDE1236574.1 glycosyltransferase family 4 protein [Vibrio aestuarianus]MDE1247453.1 glycosyltransferase family 4 protein [Vibrio aestuarianus]MDE1311042.1 glycosyltransferase family 4 protein [Vibrio aestuarianus]MDE1323947.1 glycosyltransferase family 4 protein [Vibrio aestuarianus]MDE1355731.1 glycosyltransferase family 4 protein [Vibrio aestuarianus]
MNSHPTHCIIFDPIAFKGGSKIATREALSLCDHTTTRFTVITSSLESWQDVGFSDKQTVDFISLPSFRFIAKATSGFAFWFKQCIYSLYLLFLLLKLSRVSIAIGASGPGIDMPLYLLRPIFRFKLLQFIHGPVACSRSIGYCLTQANSVFYLPSTQRSLINALCRYYQTQYTYLDASLIAQFVCQSRQFTPFVNGITQDKWPSPCQYETPVVFWCASLLKWKGLDLLSESLSEINEIQSCRANICFIRPQDISLPCSIAPQKLALAQWYEDPKNLDDIRRQSNIFVSTSHHEPFGLSILEALAAGMCVLIPQDGAYWDNVLTHDLNCIKYQPNNSNSLSEAILYASAERLVVARIGTKAAQFAHQYHAESTYWAIGYAINHHNKRLPSTAPMSLRSSL